MNEIIIKTKKELEKIIDNANQHWIISVQLKMWLGIIDKYIGKKN